MDSQEVIRQESMAHQQTKEQAKRYLEAKYGKNVWYRAPETFANLVERWMWTIASGLPDHGSEIMSEIEKQISDLREAGML